MTAAAAVEADDAPYLERLKSVPFNPVFVIGPHRSGTTILCRVLMETGCFNLITVYDLINRRRLLRLHYEGKTEQARQELARLFAAKGLEDRDIDSMKVTPDLPEEYCYALDPPARRPMLKPENVRGFLEFCRKVQAIQDSSRPLLLKNPYDTVNFLYLRWAFPHARFVFIYRNPVDIVNSQVKAVSSLLEHKNEYVAMLLERYRRTWSNPVMLKLGQWLYSEKLPFLVNSVIRHVSRNCDYILEHVGELGNSAIGVSYPELCRHPAETARAVLAFAGLEERRQPDYAALINPREPRLVPCVARRKDAILRRNAGYCRRFGV